MSKKPKSAKVSVIKRHTDLLWRRTSSKEISIIKMDELSHYYTLDGYAAHAWELFDGKLDVNEVVENLSKQSGLSSNTVKRELNKLLKLLDKAGMIVS